MQRWIIDMFVLVMQLLSVAHLHKKTGSQEPTLYSRGTTGTWSNRSTCGLLSSCQLFKNCRSFLSVTWNTENAKCYTHFECMLPIHLLFVFYKSVHLRYILHIKQYFTSCNALHIQCLSQDRQILTRSTSLWGRRSSTNCLRCSFATA